MSIFTSEFVREEYIDQGDRVEVMTFEAFGLIIRAHYPYMLDTPDVIGMDHDGEIFVASCGQVPVYDSGAWYMGDEGVLVGKVDPDLYKPEEMIAHIEQYTPNVFAEKAMPTDWTPTLR